MDEIVAMAQKRSHHSDAKASKRTNPQEAKASKKRQVIDPGGDEEDHTQAPKNSKRQRHVESDDELEMLEGEGAKGVGGEVEGGQFEGNRVEGGGVKGEEVDVKPERKDAGKVEIANLDPVNKAALDKTNRETFQELCGYVNAYDAEPQQVDDDGEPVYWTRVGPNKLATPAYNLTPELNWEKWSAAYLHIFRKKSRSSSQRKILDNLAEETIFAHFKSVTWGQHKKYAMQKEHGTFTHNVEKHKNQSLMNTRANTLLTKRLAAREGTCIAKKEFDCVFVKAAQSPQHIDPNNKKHVVRIEPEWTSDIVNDVKGGLDQLGKLSRKDTTTVEYFKHNVPIEIPGAGKRYARWMISDSYIDTHPDEWERKKFMFNLKATNAPDISEFIESVGKFERHYLDEPPEWLEEQIGICSGSPARSVLPPAPTEEQSATLPAASSEAPDPPLASRLLHPAELSSQSSRPAQPESQIDPQFFNYIGAKPVDADPPVHSEHPIHQPGDVTGFTADGRPLYAHAGDPRYPDMPSPPVGPSVDTTGTQESGMGSLKARKQIDRQAGKRGGVAAKQKEGGAAETMAEDGRLIVKLPARTTRSTAKK
ncbi:hypothetical protein FRC12_024927 [Ceratobasidium sp. 428]|nr:hypothetical protein FRC12_024927 [Ceratobasidium sp. 428]